MLQSRPMCRSNFGTAAPNAGILYAAPCFARAARQRTSKPWVFARAALYHAAASLRRDCASRRSMHQCLKPAKKTAPLVARPSVHAFCARQSQCGETTFNLLPNNLHLLALREAYSAAQNNALLLARRSGLARLDKCVNCPGNALRGGLRPCLRGPCADGTEPTRW